jgi:hypothetical protein
MKALSIRQPWAELIVQGKKEIEIRSWNTKFRGYFLIHASGMADKNMIKAFEPYDRPLDMGSIIGYANLSGVVAYRNSEEFLRDRSRHLSIETKEKYPAYGFILEDVHKIDPIKYNGKLGFFEVSELDVKFPSKFLQKELGDF